MKHFLNIVMILNYHTLECSLVVLEKKIFIKILPNYFYEELF